MGVRRQAIDGVRHLDLQSRFVEMLTPRGNPGGLILLCRRGRRPEPGDRFLVVV
jgi:hypothetical protein